MERPAFGHRAWRDFWAGMPWTIRVFGVVASGAALLAVAYALLGPPPRWGSDFDVPENRARWGMARLQAAVFVFETARGRFPESLAELLTSTRPDGTPYVAGGEVDPWGRPFRYRGGSIGELRLRSDGEDGVPNTADDVVWWGD